MMKKFLLASCMLLFVAASLGLANSNKIKSSNMTDPPTVSINYYECIGCGICIALDPFGYIESVDAEHAGFFGIKNGVYILLDSYELGIYLDIAAECPGDAIGFK